MKLAASSGPGRLAFVLLLSSGGVLEAGAFSCDLSGYSAAPGLEAILLDDALRIRWEGEAGEELQAELTISQGAPVIRKLEVRKDGAAWNALGKDLVPEFAVTTGRRRTG